MSLTISDTTITLSLPRKWLHYLVAPLGIMLAASALLLFVSAESNQAPAYGTRDATAVASGSPAHFAPKMVYYVVATQTETAELNPLVSGGSAALADNESKEVLIVDSPEAQTAIFQYLTMFNNELSQAGGSVRVVDLRPN